MFSWIVTSVTASNIFFYLSLTDHLRARPVLICAMDDAAWFFLCQHHIEFMQVIHPLLLECFHLVFFTLFLFTRFLPEPQLSLKRVTSDRHKEAWDDLWGKSYILHLALYSFTYDNTTRKIFPALVRCWFPKKWC